jgi:hypothetical protein
LGYKRGRKNIIDICKGRKGKGEEWIMGKQPNIMKKLQAK